MEGDQSNVGQSTSNTPVAPGTQNSPGYASISLYARPPDTLNAMFALLDENAENRDENQQPSEDNNGFMRMMLNRIADSDGVNWEPSPSHSSEWSVHSPETRSVFNELKSKLKDIEMIYKKVDESMVETIVPTGDILENTKNLESCVTFFKEKIKYNFDRFVYYQTQCEQEQTFLAQCTSLIEAIQNPSTDEQDFNECASGICTSLGDFTEKLNTKVSENRKNREVYWNIYKDLRDRCKLLKVVQSDMICGVCMAEEVNMALSCGHCFCAKCASRCTLCPNCRVFSSQRIKLFI
jgi:hypothetical protein